jgi:hypothetical protein
MFSAQPISLGAAFFLVSASFNGSSSRHCSLLFSLASCWLHTISRSLADLFHPGVKEVNTTKFNLVALVLVGSHWVLNSPSS